MRAGERRVARRPLALTTQREIVRHEEAEAEELPEEDTSGMVAKCLVRLLKGQSGSGGALGFLMKLLGPASSFVSADGITAVSGMRGAVAEEILEGKLD